MPIHSTESVKRANTICSVATTTVVTTVTVDHIVAWPNDPVVYAVSWYRMLPSSMYLKQRT